MKVLSIDPGAMKCGWAVLSGDGLTASYHASGVLGLNRTGNGKKEPYQAYRMRLIPYWIEKGSTLLDKYEPDRLVSEIVPAVGGGNFVVATQSQLAQTGVTVLHTLATLTGIEVTQISAGKVKRIIGGVKDASKVVVRNGVLALLPELQARRKDWTQGQMDEPDAIAVGLAELGFSL